MQLKEKQAFRY